MEDVTFDADDRVALAAAIQDAVSRIGQFVVHVEGDIRYAYTIGNAEQGCRELIVYGLRPHAAGVLLGHFGRELREGRLLPAIGDIVGGAGKVPMMIGDVHPSHIAGTLTEACARMTGRGLHRSIKAFQIIWPDVQGRYPKEDTWNDTGQIDASGWRIGTPLGSA